jgi:pyruvate dehydrogenase E1 component alpha subunit
LVGTVAEGYLRIPADLGPRLYQKLKLIRRAEERIAEIYPSDKIKSPVHLAIGQEQVAVGVCDVLHPEDVVGGTYRSHAVYLAKGGRLDAMMAEMYGKADGCCRGKGGSMHIIGTEAGVLGSSAVVGTGIPNTAGHALAFKGRREDRVAASFFGDGATEEGAFYETLNFAALQKLPILFVCENNGYAIHEPLSKRWASEDLCGRVRGFGIPAVQVADGDVFAIREAAAEAVAAIRAGEGPRFIECKIYRWREHVGPAEDYDQGYRGRDEMNPWVQADQVARLAAMLPDAERTAIDAAIEAEIAAAVDFAENSPFPGPEELHQHVFA